MGLTTEAVLVEKDKIKPVASMSWDPGSIPRWGRSPGEGNGNPFQYSFLPGEFHGQRSLVGCSPRGHKESHTTDTFTLACLFLKGLIRLMQCLVNRFICTKWYRENIKVGSHMITRMVISLNIVRIRLKAKMTVISHRMFFLCLTSFTWYSHL